MKDNQTHNNAADANGNGKNLSSVYEVLLCKTQDLYCSLPVPAWSEEEAQRNAVMWAPFLDLNWKPGFGQIRPCKVTKLSKKNNN